MEFRQRGLAIDAGDRLHQRPRQRVLGVNRPIGERRDGAADLAVAVGLDELFDDDAALAGLQLGGTIAQHEMREVEIEWMRRHVRTLRHEAHVAQRARVDDGLVVRWRDGVELAGRRVVDEVEEAGK